MLPKIGVLLFCVCCLIVVRSQQNAGKSVALPLMECYNNSELLDRERRLPASMDVLIELIRKAESGRTAQDARQLSMELIHRFRQDGILRSPTAPNSEFILPFSPIGHQVNKNRILLRQLIPGSAVNFPNETLNALEKCSMHFMLSNSVDTTRRGDEANVCNRLGRYERRVRSLANEDVEIIDENYSYKKKSNLEEGDADPDVEDAGEPAANDDGDVEIIENNNTGRNAGQLLSECPIENGVVRTRWGSVQAGTVIAGIAAGLEPQNVPEENLTFDSRFAATLAGDIVEATLFQFSEHGSIQAVGASGGWNNSQVPRWYFINSQRNYHMSDAEIKGGLDGLIMALNVQSWRTRFSTIRLSQILDMYYSPRGVFSNPDFRACNRNLQQPVVAPTERLISEATAFGLHFDRWVTFTGSLIRSRIIDMVPQTIAAFNRYITTLNDPTCEVDASVGNRTATDIIIALDTGYTYNTIHAALSYLFENIEINRFQSTVHIVNGADGSLILNTTNSVLDYHQQFNRSILEGQPSGFQFTPRLNDIEQIVRERLDEAQLTGDVGGRSTIALFIPHQATPNAQDNNFATERREIHRANLPDLRILVLGAGNSEAYNSLVTNPATDIFTLIDSSDGTNIVSSILPLASRIQEVPRRIVNPNCGSQFSGEVSAHSLEQYVEPDTVNYYRISPHYFHGDGTRNLRVRGHGYGNIVVCSSRTDPQPRQNGTAGDVNCQVIASNEETFAMSNLCDGGLISECDPFFFSVEPQMATTAPTFRCTEAECRFPDNIRYTIRVEGLGCYSGSGVIVGSFALIATLFALLRL